MMHQLTRRVATWIFSRLVPKVDRESLVGDLEEEYRLRARADSSSAPLGWYLREICCSIPPVVGIRLARAAWLATLCVALVAYFAVGLGQVLIYLAIPASVAPTYNPLGVIVAFPMVAFIGYFAERSRRRAAIVLGAIMLISITLATLLITENAPLWYRAAYFFVGPLGALVGGGFCRVTHRRIISKTASARST
jgi:hypothetical protein